MPENHNDASDQGLFAIPAGLALVLLGLGAMVVLIGRHQVAKAAAMQSWPSTMGTVADAVLRNERDPKAPSGWMQRIETRVRWTVDSRSYELTFSEYAGRGTYGHEHLMRSHGGPVRVFYDPANPSNGSLTNEQTPPHLLMLLIGIACFVLSLPFWYLSARMFVKQRRRPKGDVAL